MDLAAATLAGILHPVTERKKIKEQLSELLFSGSVVVNKQMMCSVIQMLRCIFVELTDDWL